MEEDAPPPTEALTEALCPVCVLVPVPTLAPTEPPTDTPPPTLPVTGERSVTPRLALAFTLPFTEAFRLVCSLWVWLEF